jgi:hypothetical protein
MKLLKRLWCRWRGHGDVDNSGELWFCRNCREPISYDDAVRTPWSLKLMDRIYAWKNWWKCDECGGRFGRHTDEPHIPF